MLFKPIKNSSGTIMSVNKIDLPYSDLVKFLGPPHKTNEGNQRSIALGYMTEAEWLFEFFKIPFKIRYDSSDWLFREHEKKRDAKEKVKSKQKIPPLEDMTYGEIIGDHEFKTQIILPILYHECNYKSDEVALRNIISKVFLDQMESYK